MELRATIKAITTERQLDVRSYLAATLACRVATMRAHA
jgi:hypothetical protein